MKKAAVAIVLLVAAGIASYFLLHTRSNGPAPLPEIDYSTALLTNSYKNDTFNFSLSMPGNFTARVLPPEENGTASVVLEDASRGDGVQILVTPFDEDLHELTEERIKQDVPELAISDAQPVEIGENYKGLAFKSDNEAFGGSSREVWFVFRGNLYQISTYDRLDPLLKKIFSTWKFF